MSTEDKNPHLVDCIRDDGPPPDIAGECNAHLYLGDAEIEYFFVIRCELQPSHGGQHRATYFRLRAKQEMTIQWNVDEKTLVGKTSRRKR